MNIETPSVRAYTGKTQAELRRLIKEGLIRSTDQGNRKLSNQHTFSVFSLGIRLALVSPNHDMDHGRLKDILDKELGEGDANLDALLQNTSPEQLVRDIAGRHNLKYDLLILAKFLNGKAGKK